MQARAGSPFCGVLDALGPPCLTASVGMKREPTYRTGDPIHEGDMVRFGEWEGVVETIITKESAGWEDYWQGQGEGVMLTGPTFGRLYTRFEDEDLILLQRKQE